MYNAIFTAVFEINFNKAYNVDDYAIKDQVKNDWK